MGTRTRTRRVLTTCAASAATVLATVVLPATAVADPDDNQPPDQPGSSGLLDSLFDTLSGQQSEHGQQAEPVQEPETTEPTQESEVDQTQESEVDQQPAPEPEPEPEPKPEPEPEPQPPRQGGSHNILGVPPNGYTPDFGPPPCTDAADACIDLSEHQTWLMRNGKVIYGPVPITHGRPGYITPTGTYQVTFKDKDHVSSIYGTPMPYSVFFNGGIAFHQGSLQVPSAGCIHLSPEAARTYFAELQPGEIVQVYR